MAKVRDGQEAPRGVTESDELEFARFLASTVGVSDERISSKLNSDAQARVDLHEWARRLAEWNEETNGTPDFLREGADMERALVLARALHEGKRPKGSSVDPAGLDGARPTAAEATAHLPAPAAAPAAAAAEAAAHPSVGAPAAPLDARAAEENQHLRRQVGELQKRLDDLLRAQFAQQQAMAGLAHPGGLPEFGGRPGAHRGAPEVKQLPKDHWLDIQAADASTRQKIIYWEQAMRMHWRDHLAPGSWHSPTLCTLVDKAVLSTAGAARVAAFAWQQQVAPHERTLHNLVEMLHQRFLSHKHVAAARQELEDLKWEPHHAFGIFYQRFAYLYGESHGIDLSDHTVQPDANDMFVNKINAVHPRVATRILERIQEQMGGNDIGTSRCTWGALRAAGEQAWAVAEALMTSAARNRGHKGPQGTATYATATRPPVEAMELGQAECDDTPDLREAVAMLQGRLDSLADLFHDAHGYPAELHATHHRSGGAATGARYRYRGAPGGGLVVRSVCARTGTVTFGLDGQVMNGATKSAAFAAHACLCCGVAPPPGQRLDHMAQSCPHKGTARERPTRPRQPPRRDF